MTTSSITAWPFSGRARWATASRTPPTTAGYDAVLYDVSPDALARGKQAIDSVLAKAVELKQPHRRGRGRGGRPALDQRRSRAAVDGADFVIEAVPEQIELKLQRARAMSSGTRRPTTIIASNTSALSLTEMAAALTNPGAASPACTSSIPST